MSNTCTFLQSDVSVESVPYTSPSLPREGVYLAEHFDDLSSFGKKWIKSNSKKPDVDEELAQYDGKPFIIYVNKYYTYFVIMYTPRICYKY